MSNSNDNVRAALYELKNVYPNIQHLNKNCISILIEDVINLLEGYKDYD